MMKKKLGKEYLLHKSVDCTWEEDRALKPVFQNVVKDYTLKCQGQDLMKTQSSPDASHQQDHLQRFTNPKDVVVGDSKINKDSIQPSNKLAEFDSYKNNSQSSPSVLQVKSQEKCSQGGLVPSRLLIYATPKLSNTLSEVQDQAWKQMTNKEYICPAPHCCFKFDQKDDLDCHISTYHTGEITYSCPHCSLSFQEMRSFEEHMQLHVGTAEKPFACSLCDFKFPKSGILNRHFRQVHKGIKPYTCDTCGRKFFNSSGLEQHIRSHTGECPFKCSECEKSYRSPSGLQRHMLVHKGIKAYKCETCGKSFTQKPTLQAHIRIHTGEKPFKCEICGKTFVQLSSRNYHVKICLNKMKGREDEG